MESGQTQGLRGRTGQVLTLQDIPMPADTISGDFISAGWLLAHMDLAGGRRAYEYIGGRSVTVGIEAMSFKKPVFIGDLVTFYTDVIRQGRTSLAIGIETWAMRRKDGSKEKVTEGVFTFVAIDENRRPVEIPVVPGPSLERGVCVAGKKGDERSEGDPGELTIRAIPMPRDANYLGDVFGGWILTNMDLACAKAAEKLTGRRAATVGIEAMCFHRPALIGDQVSFYTRLVKTGNTSVTMKVETRALRRGDVREEKVTEGVFTYVSVDESRRPVAIG